MFYHCPADNCLYLVPRCLDDKCPNHGGVLSSKPLIDYVRENTHAR